MTRRTRTSREAENRLGVLESETAARRGEHVDLSAEERVLAREVLKYRREREAATTDVGGEGPAVTWADAIRYASQCAMQGEGPTREEFYGAGWWYDPEEWDPIVADMLTDEGAAVL